MKIAELTIAQLSDDERKRAGAEFDDLAWATRGDDMSWYYKLKYICEGPSPLGLRMRKIWEKQFDENC